MTRQEVVIGNAQGLHARAAARFVQTAERFKSRITVSREGRSADGKSILASSRSSAVGLQNDHRRDGPDEQALQAARGPRCRPVRGGSVSAPGPREGPEIFQGVGVSPGIAVGKALVLEGPRPAAARSALEPADLPGEVARFRSAVRAAWRQLRRLRDRVRSEAGESCARVFQAQILILRDRALLKETVALIRRERANAGWAYRTVVDRHIQVFATMDDPDLRERASDIEDVESRVQAILSGTRRLHDVADLREDTIIVSAALGPSEAAGLGREHILGLAVDRGGPTSHTAILSSALGVPAVVGPGPERPVADRRPAGARWVGGHGGPQPRPPGSGGLGEAAEPPPAAGARPRVAPRSARNDPRRRAGAADGESRVPRGDPCRAAPWCGGIGLYRSEFLYLREAPALPDEETHYSVYRDLAERAMPHAVVIRTLDLRGGSFRGSTTSGCLAAGVARHRLPAPPICRGPDCDPGGGARKGADHASMISGLIAAARAPWMPPGGARSEDRPGEVPVGDDFRSRRGLMAESLASAVYSFSMPNDLIQYTLPPTADRGGGLSG
jgi:phosphotransferase system enzyme I (PtsI)